MTKTAYEKWCDAPFMFKFFRGCIGKLLGIPAPLLSGRWIPRFDQNGEICMLLKEEEGHEGK